MKTQKRIIALAIAILMTVLVSSTAISENRILRFSYTASISAGLSISGSTARATGSIIPRGNHPTDIVVSLQQQQSDGTWSTVASWSGSNTAGYSDAGGTATIATGYTYRTYVVGHVYDSSGNVLETATAYKY